MYLKSFISEVFSCMAGIAMLFKSNLETPDEITESKNQMEKKKIKYAWMT